MDVPFSVRPFGRLRRKLLATEADKALEPARHRLRQRCRRLTAATLTWIEKTESIVVRLEGPPLTEGARAEVEHALRHRRLLAWQRERHPALFGALRRTRRRSGTAGDDGDSRRRPRRRIQFLFGVGFD